MKDGTGPDLFDAVRARNHTGHMIDTGHTIDGHIKISAWNDGWFDVLFFRQDADFGGPAKAHRIFGIESLKRFMESLGCPLSGEQVLDAQQMKPIRGTRATKHASIRSGDHRRYFA